MLSFKFGKRNVLSTVFAVIKNTKDLVCCARAYGLPSQRSLHNAPIFRLLLKVAVNGTHQCDFYNFWGALGPQQSLRWRVTFRSQQMPCCISVVESSTHWNRKNIKTVSWRNRNVCAYLLGLLAMIKCSICSYQCDNWYVSNWRLACHIYFSLGRCISELARDPSCVALASHPAGCSTPFGVTMHSRSPKSIFFGIIIYFN